MSDHESKLPDQEELEKELSEYLSKKYGQPIKVVSPMMVPRSNPAKGRPKEPKGVERIRFDLKPEQLEAYLDRYVVKQDLAKSVLATKVCTHYNRIRGRLRKGRRNTGPAVGRIKNNIILMGPTGVGKTYLVKLIADKLGVPFVKGDATKFSETGYVGGDVEDLVRDLVVQADDDLELAQYGIVYVDEIDKIAFTNNLIGPDVSRTGVQRALLKPLEETEVDLKVAHDPISQMQAIEQFRKTGKREKRTISTRDILFIVSGAFNGLAAIIQKRLQAREIGFGAKLQSKSDQPQWLKHVKAEDLIAYGFESEFIGRLPVTAVLEPLEQEDLYQILNNPNNPILLSKKEDFRSYGIDLRFTDDALRLLAAMAYQEQTGARGLVSVIERALLPFEKRMPSSSVDYLVVDRDLVEHPDETLAIVLAATDSVRAESYRKMLEGERTQVWEQVAARKPPYLAKHPLVFNDARLQLVAELHLKEGVELKDLFEEVIQVYSQILAFEDDFNSKYGFRVHFQDDAIDRLVTRAMLENQSASAICWEISKDYDYSFRLIAERSGQTQFILPQDAVIEPETYLDGLIRETYRRYPLETMDRGKEA
ncbi:MAG: ATPase [Syntrophobacteraceae bacterium CG07_land_8_20_14_0_80_61_8]|nr:MAG: ATPase [Syntrophobacteraceae bacterium CG07_land_8_20_14_0_80_61_8]